MSTLKVNSIEEYTADNGLKIDSSAGGYILIKDGTISSTEDAALSITALAGQTVTIESATFDGGAVGAVTTLDMSGNLTVGGTVDGVDIAAFKSSYDSLDAIVGDVTASEMDQVENIGATTISAAQWGYLGGLDQELAQASNVTFSQITGTLQTAAQGNITSLGTLTTLQVDNINLNGNTISSTSGDIDISPVAGSDVVIDTHFEFDGNLLTALTDNNTVIAAYAGKNITIESVTFAGGDVGSVGTLTATTLAGTLSTAAQTNITSLGTLTALQVDNLNFNGNTLSSTTGDINITPLAGEDIILDAHWQFDGADLTALTDNNTVINAYTGKNVTIESVTFAGGAVGGITTINMSGNLTVGGTVDGVDIANGVVQKTTFDANTILKSDSDDTPAALTVAEQTLVGRITSGVITALTATEVRTLLNIEDGADVTDATNVDTAGAVMESDYDAQTVLAATVDNTPSALTVSEQTVVGRLTGGNVTDISIGIADNNVVQMDDADAADNDYAKFTSDGLEGRSYSEVRTDLEVLKCSVGSSEPSSPATNDLWIDTA